MGAITILFWIAVGLAALIVVLGVIGLILKKWNAARGKTDPAQQPEAVLPEKTVENVLNVNDRFNRARYMDKDHN